VTDARRLSVAEGLGSGGELRPEDMGGGVEVEVGVEVDCVGVGRIAVLA